MKSIKAYTSFCNYTKQHYYRTFDLVARLYDPEDPFYNNELVEYILPVTLDIEQGNPEVYEYSYYEIVTIDEGEKEQHYFVACKDIYKYSIDQSSENLIITLCLNSHDLYKRQKKIMITPGELATSSCADNYEYVYNKITEEGIIDPALLDSLLRDVDRFIVEHSKEEGGSSDE